MTEEQRQRKLAKQREYQQRARERQLAKLTNPAYIEKQREKQRCARARQIEKRQKRNAPLVTKKPLKQKGMAGKARSRNELSLHDAMGALGCICCINSGLSEAYSGTPVSIHHIKGRTSRDAHKFVLPLCGWHHDTPLPPEIAGLGKYKNEFPLHAKGKEGGKSAWERVNGSQLELLRQVLSLLGMNEIADELVSGYS